MQGVVRAGANDYRVTMYKTFTIPLNLLCTQFDSNPMLYLNALNNSQLQFTIDFQDATVAKIFGTAGPNAGAVAYNVVTPLIFDDSLTGIVDIGIKTINKNDKSYQDDLRDQGLLKWGFKPYDCLSIATRFPTNGRVYE